MKRLKTGTCLLLSVVICFMATGCNMNLYEEVLSSEKYIEGKPQTIQVESQVEKTIDKEVEVWVEGSADADNSNDDYEEIYSPIFEEKEKDFEKETKSNIEKGLYKNKVNDIYFGYFGNYMDPLDYNWGSHYITSDHCNVFFGSVADLPTYKKYNCKVWIQIDGYLKKIEEELKYGTDTGAWEASFDKLNQSVIDSGAEDACLGWYLDEPTNMKAMLELTKYAQKYGRRFFVCFAVNNVSPRSYGGYKGENYHTTREYTQYLTDVAFDCYWSVESNQKMFENMREDLYNTCPEDAYIWYIPGTYTYYSSVNLSSSQLRQQCQEMIENLEYFYDFLMEEKKPGGLMCFAGNADLRGEKIYGLRQMQDKTNKGWQLLEDACRNVGKRICTMKLSDKK